MERAGWVSLASALLLFCRMQRIRVALLVVTCASTGCAPMTDLGGDGDAVISADSADATVGTYLKRIPCSTQVIRPLSQQLIDELLCTDPAALEPIGPQPNLSFSDDSVLPYLEPKAAASLRLVAAGGRIVVTSATRTVAQQYLLSQWKAANKCGIPAAAEPGTSQHESGHAVDVHVTTALTKRLLAAGWARETGEDPIHFIHADPDVDLTRSITAFQRLWNHNRQNDAIPESGVLDAVTIARLRATPAIGFAGGPSCSPPASTPPATEGEAATLTE